MDSKLSGPEVVLNAVQGNEIPNAFVPLVRTMIAQSV
jgi:hypothetical protein